MKTLLLIALTVAFSAASAQNSYVYKRNLLTGNLELYQSSGGFPVGSPIFQIKKNVWGYIEIEGLEVNTNPFSRRPDYSNLNTFNSYTLPSKDIINSIQVINKKTEYDRAYIDGGSNYSSQKIINEMKRNMRSESDYARSLLDIYNSTISFPSSLSDGWYEVVDIHLSNRGVAFDVDAPYSYWFGICKVRDNKVVEYYRNMHFEYLKDSDVFEKSNLESISSISNCKSVIKPLKDDRFRTLYFIDNIFDSAKQINDPKFTYYSIFTEDGFVVNNNSWLAVQIAKNRTFRSSDSKQVILGPYESGFDKPNDSKRGCRGSTMIFAFKHTGNPNDRFSIAIRRMSDMSFWTANDIPLNPGVCSGTILREGRRN